MIHLPFRNARQAPWPVFLVFTLTAQAQITFPPDITISRVEVLQGTQDQEHTVPLTAAKATAVRAFIRQEGRPEAIINNITAVVRGFRNGVELPLSPLRAVNPAIPARLEPDRGNVSHSQNFVLPLAWTQAGQLELRAELRLPAGAVEAPPGNNTTSRTVEFVQPVAAAPRIAWLPVCVGGRCPTGGFQYQRLTERLFPFSDGTLRYEDVPAPALNWPGSADDEALLATLEKQRLLLGESGAAPHVIIGWLPAGTAVSSPIVSRGSAMVLTEQSDQSANERLLARALASGYSNPSDNPCSAFILDPGLDPLTARFIPGDRIEFTSSCATSSSWTSPLLARYLAATLSAFRPGPQSTDGRLVLSGSIRDDGTAGFDPAIRASARVPLTPTSVDGESVIRITTESGTQDYPFFLNSRFAVSVPYSGALSTVALIRGGSELAALSTGGAPPSVSFSALPDSCETRCTLSWIAADPSSRNLSYSVFYSSDDGSSWVPLAAGFTATGMTVDTAALTGPRVLFRVVAAAGLDQAEATSSPVTLLQSPLLEVPSPSFDFGSVTLGQISEKGITVRNTGNAPLQFTTLTTSKEVFQAGMLAPVRIRPGTEIALPVRYQPRTSGADTANLNLASNDPAAPSLDVALRASVFDRPVSNAVLSTLAIDFGETAIGQPAEATLSMRNDGTAPLNIANTTIVNARFSVVSPLGAFTIEAGDTRTIVVRFLPNAAGLQTGALVITSNDPSNPSVRADLRGTGFASAAPNIDLSPTSLDFGSVNINQTRSLELRVRNAGTGTLTINSLAVVNSAFSVLTPVTPVSVPGGQTQIVSMRFAPSALGPANGNVTIDSNDPNRPRIVVNLAGTGLTATPAATPVITSLIPASLVQGALRFDLTVLGSAFSTASQVLWNGSPRPTVFIDTNRITASIAPEDVASATEAQVTVSTPGVGVSSSQRVVVSGLGHAARITNIETASCPTVIATVTVTDLIGNPVTALNSGNLACSEDGVSVPCTANLAVQQGFELSTVMVLHRSAGILDENAHLNDLNTQVRYARRFISSVQPTSRLFLTMMDNGVRPLIDQFTIGENKDALNDAVNRFSALPRGVGTSLYDAIEDGLQRLASETGRRKALIILSGKENTYDTSGPRDLNAFFRTIQTSGVPIFFFPIGEGYRNPNFLSIANQIALYSGGELFRDDRIEVELVLQRLSASLYNQHRVNYNSVNRDGQSHHMRIGFNIPTASFTAARSYQGCR
jgi:hypothetical protein